MGKANHLVVSYQSTKLERSETLSRGRIRLDLTVPPYRRNGDDFVAMPSTQIQEEHVDDSRVAVSQAVSRLERQSRWGWTNLPRDWIDVGRFACQAC
jgi:hypothetical protein